MDNELTPGAGAPPVHREEAGADISNETLASLLGKAAPPESGQSENGEEQAGKPVEPTFNALAQQHGVDPDALYKATVTLPDELGTATIEQLKDDAAKFRKGKAQSTAFDEERTDFANVKLRAMQELQAMVVSVPQEHQSPELKQAYDAYIAQQQGQQDQILQAALPAWSDQAVKAKDHDDMRALTAQYGLPSEFIDSPMMAGVKKMIHDYTQLKLRIDGIKGKHKQPRSKGSGSVPHHDAGSADRVKAAVAKGDKIGAIAQLLTG